MEPVTLKVLRERSNKTQQQAADALGITKQAYGRKERGLRLLQAEEARILAELFGVTYEEVLLAPRVTDSDTEEGRQV